MSRILVVEDSPTQAERVRLILEGEGFDVELARDGEEGREKLETSTYDLVVSDILMPRLSGYELCRWLKANAATQDVPLVLLTALNDPLDIIQAVEAGADNFISKRYEPAYLVSRIRSILENRRFRSEGKLSVNVELYFMGRRLTIGSGREQILGLLLSAFEDMVRTNRDLRGAQAELGAAKEKLEEYARKLESRVRASEEMYGTLMHEASDAIFLLDDSGVVLEANRRAAELTGRTVDDLVGRRAPELVMATQRIGVERLIGELTAGRSVQPRDFVAERPDGSRVEVETSVSKVEVQGRGVILALLRDVTEKRHAERRAATQHEVTRILAESSGLEEAAPRLLETFCGNLGWDRGVLWQVDRETQALRRMGAWGGTPAGGREDTAPNAGSGTDSRLSVAARVRDSGGTEWIPDLVREGGPGLGAVTEPGASRAGVGFPIVSDGAVLGVVELLSPEVRPVDADLCERLASFGSQIAQFVERRLAEEAMRESEERYRNIFEQARDLVFTVRSDRVCSSMSPSVEETTGWRRSDAVGRRLSDFLHPDDVHAVLEIFAKSIAGERCPTSDLRVLRKSGDYLDMELSVTPLRRGGQVELLGLARDITERKRVEAEIRRLNAELEARVRLRTAQLEAANRGLESFSYSVSHDLRAPLRAIDGYSKVLLDSSSGRLDAEDARLIECVRRATRRMSQLIDDLLEFSRLGRKELKRSRLDLTALVEAVWKELTAADKGPPAELRLQPLPEVLGDPTLLRQVMENLLSNALKFSARRERRIVEVGTEDEGSERAFFVRDNGAGFDMQYAGKLFGVFQRLHDSSEFEGTGVGLALVKQIVEKHGGRIRVTGEVDAGATVTFTLPEASQREDAPQIGANQAPAVGGRPVSS